MEAYLATGHYAQIGYNEATGRYDISKGTDDHKDQAYALYRLTQEQLAHIMTPLGGWVKTDTRREAAVRNLPVANKPESQEICFVPDNYKDYLLEHRPDLRAAGGHPRCHRIVGRRIDCLCQRVELHHR